jgi:hypothetical protein
LIDDISGISVGGGRGEACCRQSDSLVGSVVDRVESLEESHAEDEIESGSTIEAIVLDNQINVTENTTNIGIKAPRPDLSVSSQFECSLVKKEKMLSHTASDRPMKEYVRQK